MKFRRPVPATLPAVPPPANEEMQAALAIVQCINQGMPGAAMADTMNLFGHAEQVKLVASSTLDETIAWFRREPQAAQILDAAPGFPKFASEFHARALKLYPPQAPQ